MLGRRAGSTLFAAALALISSGVPASGLQAAPATGSPPTTTKEPPAKNQASPADTIILPPPEDDSPAPQDGKDAEASAPGGRDLTSIKRIAAALETAGITGPPTIALVDALVDADGCQTAPLNATYVDQDTRSPYQAGRHSISVDALAGFFRAHGFAVTILSGSEVAAADTLAQKRLAAKKGTYQIQFGNSENRHFPTASDLLRCTKILSLSSPEAGSAWKVKHPAMLRQMTALRQNVVLAVAETDSESHGAKWNIMEQELSSTGNGLDKPRASAQLSAKLILRDGSIPWSGETSAESALRSPVEEAALRQLTTYLQAKIRETTAQPDTPTSEGEDRAVDAIAAGDLAQAPEGTTLGPSLWKTKMATAERLYDQIGPALHPH